MHASQLTLASQRLGDQHQFLFEVGDVAIDFVVPMLHYRNTIATQAPRWTEGQMNIQRQLGTVMNPQLLKKGLQLFGTDAYCPLTQ